MTAAKAGTTVKEALSRWEEKNPGVKVQDAKAVKLYAQVPPIDKMDGALSQLKECDYLSLSTNSIEKIANLNALKQLRVLSLGRNSIKSFVGLETVGDTLEQLWISYNLIEKMKGVNALKRLRVLYMSQNKVKDFRELEKLKELESLEDLNAIGNPIALELGAVVAEAEQWRPRVIAMLPRLKKLDNKPTIGGSMRISSVVEQ